jgi:hypothetical protein
VTSTNFDVVYNGHSIGFIDARTTLNKGDNIILSGRQWLVQGISIESNTILVQISTGGRAVFTSDGEFPVHQKIHEKMQEIYEQKITDFPYLNQKAKELLQEGVDEYALYQKQFLLVYGGTKVQNTLSFLFHRFMSSEEFEALENLEIGFFHPKGRDFLLGILDKIIMGEQTFFDLFENVDQKHIQKLNKFDGLLSKELLVEEYIRVNFNVVGAKMALERIKH